MIDLNVMESKWQQPKQLSGIQLRKSHLETVTVYSADTYFISSDKNCWQEQPILRPTNRNRALLPSLRAEMRVRLFNKSMKERTLFKGFHVGMYIRIQAKRMCLTLKPGSILALFKLACQISFHCDLVHSY